MAGDRMTLSVLRTNESALMRSTLPSEHEMMVYHTMAEQAVSSKMYKGIGEKSGVMMIMLSARELGIPAMQALNGGINIIQGKVEISARMMSALIRKSGHMISVKQSTDAGCILVGKRCDTGETLVCSYYFIEAQKAGLVKTGGGWTKCPKDMCFARALSRLARQLFSDVIGIGYVEGEIRPTEAVISIPDDIPELQEITHDIETLHSMYFDLFHESHRDFAQIYLDQVSQHFQWPIDQTIVELLKDKDRVVEKFRVWLKKHLEENETVSSD